MEPTHYVIAIVGGFLAGIINTLAGNGSAITLTILTEVIGLPGNMANGTNRVGIMAQGISSLFNYKKNDKLHIARGKHIIIPTVIGAIIGVLVAVWVSNEQFKSIFRFLMIIILVILLVNPKKWLIPDGGKPILPPAIMTVVFLLLGFYGGFIQMGMGVYFLATMVLLAKYNIAESNVLKIVVVSIYTVIVLAIFQYNGLVDWKVGGIMAIGQASGGWFGASFASNYPKADLWAYRLLIFVVIAAVIKMFELHTYLPFFN